MATRLLIIHKQLVFAVTLKQALEQTGGFAVHPFTKAEAAFDFLRDHPQDVALVDFNLPGRSGARVIQQLRALQDDIAIIVTPQLSSQDMRNLGVQASIEAPFTARDLLPLLQNALDEIPADNVSSMPPSGGQMTTSNLGEQKRIKRQQMGTTENLGDHSLYNANEPAQTNILPSTDEVENKPQTKPLVNNPLKPSQGTDQQDSKPITQPFIDNPTPVKPVNNTKIDPFKTRVFEDDELTIKDLRPPSTKPLTEDVSPPPELEVDLFSAYELPEEERGGTKILSEEPPENYPVETRRLGNDDDPDNDSPQTRNLGRQTNGDPYGTRPLGEPEIPTTTPEFSALDHVLANLGMDEPPAEEMDTPSVPTKNSDALRQFIATNNGQFDAESFDDVLGAIEPDSPETPKKQRQVDFEGLVKSMQRDEPQSRLPDRQQQQLLDFVLTTGMDSVLQEIEKTKTGHLPKMDTPPSLPEVKPLPPKMEQGSSFRTLAEEEPPLPTLEENGTVSDLLVGISDSNFRDVLALLNDSDSPESVEPKSKPKQKPKSKPKSEPEAQDPDSNYFEDFLQSTTVDSDSVPVPSQPRRQTYDFNFDYDDEEDGATVAGVVLRSTQENTAMPGEFSLDQLMSDINERLTTHKLKLRPLPSWDMDTTTFNTPVKDVPELPKVRRPNEPSFLPEMFPPDEIIPPLDSAPPELPQLESNEVVSEVWTTRASEPSLETIEPVDENAETTMEPGYFEETDETIEHQPVPTIDSDMFSGILDANTDFDEAARYDSEAESSSNQTAFAWEEPDVTVEITPEGDYPSTGFESDFAAAIVEDFETQTAPTDTQQLSDDFNATIAQQIDLPSEEQVESWDEPAAETTSTATSFDDAWNDFTSEPIAEEFNNDNWDVQAPEPIYESEAVVESVNADSWDTSESFEQEPVVDVQPLALSEEARIAQLALNLTQVSLETSAEGTILTRDNAIIALAGHLSQQDTIELGNVINNDWSIGGQGARLRFITLPSSGKEYMLYSTATEDNLILSMIFLGTTPLRVIRQQGQRLVKALGEVPDIKPSTTIPSAPRRDTQPVEEALEPYAYVWLVRDPEQRLDNAVAQSITAGLMTQLSEMHWQIEQLQVQDEYVYLYANVPGEMPSYAIIRELKKRAASIAQKQDSNLEPQGLWADSYLVLSPGRELAPDEIQEFVDFQRMM